MLTTNKTLQTKSTVCQGINTKSSSCLPKCVNTCSGPTCNPTTGRKVYASNPSLLQPSLRLRSKL